MQTQKRLRLESIILKSYKDSVLNTAQSEMLEEIIKEFSKDGKAVSILLFDLIEKEFYEETYFYQKALEVIKDDNFRQEFLTAEKMAHVAPLIKDYETYIKLDKQEAFANELYAKTKELKVLDLNLEILEQYSYTATKEEFKTFKELESNIDIIESSKTYPTGVEFLDTAFNGGLTTGQLILVGGDPEAGKTTITTQILENMTQTQYVGFFCFEFTTQAYIKRRITQPNELFIKERMFVITDGYDIREIADNILKMHKQRGMRVFAIDSQMRIENNESVLGNGEEKESEKFEILGKMAHKYDLIIFMIIQTSKADPNTPFKSKKGAHEASIIMHLENIESKNHSSEDNLKPKRLIVKKNKQTGKHFKEDVFIDYNMGQFIKDPNHVFKDSNYNARNALNKAAEMTLDLDSIPNF